MGTAYGTAPLLGWTVESKQIEPHVPVWDKTVCKEGSLSIGEFRWQPERNEYVDVAYSGVLHLHPAAGHPYAEACNGHWNAPPHFALTSADLHTRYRSVLIVEMADGSGSRCNLQARSASCGVRPYWATA